MVFGTCCLFKDANLHSMTTKSVKIEGMQHGLITNFEVTQIFLHSESELQEVRYVFPNDLKMCIYDTTFVVGQEVIKPKLLPREEAEITYKEAVNSDCLAVFGSNTNDCMTEFKLGNVPPGIECKVILKIAITAKVTTETKFFIKFPLDVYTPSGSSSCIGSISSDFEFKMQSNDNNVSKITSNVINGKYDELTKVFSINERIQNHDNENSIIITFEGKEKVQSSILLSQSDSSNYDCCALSIVPNLQKLESPNIKEFVFVVDCSGSMEGESIMKASQCLDLFIHSLPPHSYYNIYRFGTSFTKLYEESIEYNDQTAKEGIQLASHLNADLGCTEIQEPLKDIFALKPLHGQRQIFILTDGEVFNVGSVLSLVSCNSKDNRCFTIGIGRGCDAGLVEGIAQVSGGKCDFVQEGDSISEKVIPQLLSSLHAPITSAEIHIQGENNNDFMVSPFPVPNFNPADASVVFLRKKKRTDRSSFDCGVLVNGEYNNETVDFTIEKVELLEKYEQDDLGCSHGRNISDAILPLFAFNMLKSVEGKRNVSESEKEMAIDISISSGVLCKFTGYIGIIERRSKIYDLFNKYKDDMLRATMKSYTESGGTILSSSWDTLQTANTKNKCNDGNSSINTNTNDSLSSITDSVNKLSYDDASKAMKKSDIESGRTVPSSLLDTHQTASTDDGNSSINTNTNDSLSRFTDSVNKLSYDDASKAIKKSDIESGRTVPSSSLDTHQTASTKDQCNDKAFDFMSITQLQKADGFWDDLDALNKMLGSNVNCIDSVKVSCMEMEIKCLATILAIAALRKKASKYRNSLLLIEQKAIIWLKNQLNGVDVEQIIASTQSLI